ncbi:MAG: hypothetical protein RPR97_07485, partial [Colwellia sp.]
LFSLGKNKMHDISWRSGSLSGIGGKIRQEIDKMVVYHLRNKETTALLVFAIKRPWCATKYL